MKRFLIAGLVLASAVSVAGARQADDRKPAAAQLAATDLYGDPLPPGAIARLGTMRDSIGEVSGDIVVSSDGKYVTATTLGWWIIPLRLWDVGTGRVIKHLKELEPPDGHSGVRRVAFSHDGKLLAAGDGAGIVRIGTTDSGQKIRELGGPDAVSYMAFLPDGKCLAVGYRNGAILLFRLSTGERIRSLAMAPIYSSDSNLFSPDGTMVPVQRLDGSVVVRQVLTGRIIPRLSFGGIFRAFSPDDKLLALRGRHGLELRDVATGRQVRRLRYPRIGPRRHRSFGGVDDDSVEFHLVFSPDGKHLAGMDTPSSTCLWSVATGQPYRRFPHLDSGHGIAFTADGKRLISGGRYFHYWDIARCQEIRRYPKQDEVEAVAFGPGGKLLATADRFTVRLWDTSKGRELRQFHAHGANLSAVAFSPDGKIIASEDEDAIRILWDVNTGREIRRDGDPGPVREARRAGYYSWTPAIAFAPDGKTYVADDIRGTCLWDVATGRELRRLSGANKPVRSTCFAPNGETLAGAYGHGAVIWEVATGRKKQTLDHLETVQAVAFAPGGRILATADSRGSIVLFDLETAKKLRQFGNTRHRIDELPMIVSLAFLPDGKTLAAGGADSFVRLWNTETGQLRGNLEGHTQSVFSLAISPDGHTLATASQDGTTLIWDATNL